MPLWTPAQITTALWLDAADSDTITLSGSDVTQWDDKSGNNRHATPDVGTLTVATDGSGRQHIDFDDAAMNLPALGISGAAPRSVFAVVDQSAGQNITAFLSFNAGPEKPAGTRWSFCLFDSTTTNLRIEIAGAGYTSSLSALNLGIHACLYDGGDLSGHTIYRDGVSESATGSDTVDTTDVDNSLGRRASAFTVITARYYEVIVLPENANAELRETVEGYLAHKWGLEGNLPGGHPYKDDPPEIPLAAPTNLQATPVSTNQNNVTWDAVAGADGYEIEIDSGTPIDVGNVLAYEDTGLDPGATRSYRVRAYAAGSPTEFSEWAGPVEATTESVAAIPRRFVIVADIRLSTEAPELGEPPQAETKDAWALAWRNSISSNLRIYKVLPTELGSPNTLSAAAGSQVLGAAWRPDNGLFVVGQAASPHTSFRTFDPETGAVGANTAISGGPDANTRDFSFSADGLRMVMAHNRNGTGDFADQSLSLWAHDPGDNSFTLLDTYDGGAGSRAARISPDGRWIIHENDVNNSRFRVLEVVNDELVERGQLTINADGRVNGAAWFQNNARAIVYRAGLGQTSARLVDIDSAGVPSIADDGAALSATGGTASLSKAEDTMVLGGAVDGTSRVFAVGSGGFTELHTIPTVQVRHPGWIGGSLFVGADSTTIRLFSWDGSASALLDTDAWSSTVQGIRVTR